MKHRIQAASLLCVILSCASTAHSNDITLHFDSTADEDAASTLEGAKRPGSPDRKTTGLTAEETRLDRGILANFDPLSPLEPAIDSIESLVAMKMSEPTSAGLLRRDSNLWNRIRNGFAIPNLNLSSVDTQIALYTEKPQHIERTTLRASKYLYHVVEEIEKRRMPMELALLPFVESGFNPLAYSSANAAGMWQFIPSTATNFKLKVNAFKDERRDVIASTDAALTYLQKLHSMFGDWQLALAAYNWGEGSVMRAIAANKAAGQKTSYTALLSRMPEETRNYVPRLMALKAIISKPASYKVTLPTVRNEPYFTAMAKVPDIDVKLAAQLAEMSVDEFNALNPQFNSEIITGSNTRILLPTTQADKFRTNLRSWGKKLTSWTAHQVNGARERVEAIASRFGTTPDIIREANHIPARMQVLAGSTLLVPRTTLSDGDIGRDIVDRAKIMLTADSPIPKKWLRTSASTARSQVENENPRKRTQSQ